MPAMLSDDQKPVSFMFPLRGIDMSTGYHQQPPGTCPSGQNVRAYDAGTLRMRGGSRPGLTPFLGAGNTQQVAGTHVVQHLGCIVWVSASAVG